MDALRRLFVWWGWRRVVGVTVGVPVAVFAVWWMVRAPAPPVESQIPFAPDTTLASLVELGVGALAASDLGAGSAAIASAPTTLVVHIVGAVQRPGVYELPNGARGDDAVRAAGGQVPAVEVAIARDHLDSAGAHAADCPAGMPRGRDAQPFLSIPMDRPCVPQECKQWPRA